ncbi:MAG TPA: sigma-70 family RNA polymerase sigma factor [Chthonomonadaceae bacterium]|nr:sigma-70 family RNA polymerase sigma factor [Chthonomonadaceae bacterium]
MEDDLLMQKAAAGDVEAFGQLVQAYQRRLVRFAERMTGDAEAAEDAAQEAFLRLWRTRATYRPQGSLSSYLLRIVRNLCLDHARKDFAATRRERIVPGSRYGYSLYQGALHAGSSAYRLTCGRDIWSLR